MKLNQIFENIEFKSNINLNSIDLYISNICYNSSLCNHSTIFVALKGQTLDGHNFVTDAISRGCTVFVLEDNMNLPDNCTKIIVENTRKTLAKMSANFFGNPSKEIKVIGITGTKGKTTITNYLSSVLNSAGINTGVIGTNGTFYNGTYEKTINTTPESYELQRILRDMLDNGVECVAMEVSSGGLMLDRVLEIDFDVVLFSNISPDHISPLEHPDFEDYLRCKSKLFKMSKLGVINADDSYLEYVSNQATCQTKTFSIYNDSDIKIINIKYSRSPLNPSTEFTYLLNNKTYECSICCPGEFSVYNALSVISICSYLGIEQDTIHKALSTAKVKGRTELLHILPHALVVIDYAHNRVSLENILSTLKNYDHNRIITLFGSVGGRTQGRRKELGEIAAKYSDLCILTSDNPDFEDPMDIIKDIEQTVSKTNCDYIIEPDRELAIQKAIQLSTEGDIILLAGKGHEKYQLIRGERVPFDEEAIATLAANNFSKHSLTNLT